jgi:UrcA family protein
MVTSNQVRRSISLAFVVVGLTLAGSVSTAEELKEVTIQSTRETKIIVGRSDIGAPVEEITLTRRVTFRDLDLATAAGGAELEKRVKDAARALCQELDRRSPLMEKTAVPCAKTATENAMIQVQAAIAAARKP